MKSTLLTCCLLFSLLSASAWGYNNVYVHLIMQTLHDCYEQQQDKSGVELAQCMGHTLGQKANPEEYRVKIYEADFDKTKYSPFHILIYNKAGYRLNCTGMAGKRIILQSCTSHGGRALSPAELMSINRPEQ